MNKDDLSKEFKFQSNVIDLINHKIGAISGISKEQQANSADVRFWLSGVQIIAEDGKTVEGVCLFQAPNKATECKDELNAQFMLARSLKKAKIMQYPVF